MKKFLIYWLAVSGYCGFAAAPSWKDLQASVQGNDFARVQSWINENGIESATAANALMAAAIAGDRPMIDRLLALGISVNLTNYYGATALIKAADNGNTEIVRALLKCGAKANAVGRCDDVNCKGHTALMGAACKQDVAMARMLLEAGADPHVADNAATETANQNGDLELYLLLSEFGGRPRVALPTEPETTIPIGALGLTELLPQIAPNQTAPEKKSKTRLSVIADDSNILLGDLLTAQLSSQTAFELVERQELDRLLAEQRLTRQFAANAANYSQVAALLRADALLLIQAQKVADTKVVESRLVRVDPGLVLDTVYSSAPVLDPSNWAERISARISGISAKVSRQDAIALSLLGIRSSIKSSADRGLDQSIATLLSDRLAHQPHFVLLERAAMKRVAAESAGAFWAGAYLVDGIIEPALDGGGAFTLLVRFFQPSDEREALNFISKGNRANPAGAVDDLLLKINSRLKQSQAPQKRDIADEAQQYFEEAKWAFAAQRGQIAQSAAEAAWALGSRSIELAQLRVSAAMLNVRQSSHQSGRKQDMLGPAGWLDLALHGLTVWRDTLDDEVLRAKPHELQRWLEFGFEASDGAVFGMFQIDTVAEQAKQNARLEKIREALWETLEEVRKRSAKLPGAELLENRAAEKAAALARLLFPRTPDFVRNGQDLMTRHFKKDDVLTRARVRANLIACWTMASVPFQESPTTRRTINLRISRGDEASRQFADQLRNSLAPEDRYISALLILKRAAARGETTQAEVERLCASLLDLQDLLAEGGEVFERYFELFNALDGLGGAPFFTVTRHESGNRMWERHTAAHSEFRRRLFLALMNKATKGDPQFQRMLSRDEFSSEQQSELIAAQSRLASTTPVRTKAMRTTAIVTPRGSGSRPLTPNSPSNSNPTGEPSKDIALPLQVRRLWHPFNLELKIAPEFDAHWGSLQWIEGRLWLNGTTLNKGGQPDRHYIFCIDPATMRTETFALPERASTVEGRLTIASTHLVLAMREYLAVFDRAKRRWDTYGEIKLAHGGNGILINPLVVGQKLYLVIAEAPGNALISFDRNTRASEIIASPARRPAASPLDDPNVKLGSIATNEAGDIVIAAGKVRHAWSPGNRTWHSVEALPTAASERRTGLNRIGNIRLVENHPALHLVRKDSPPMDVPLTFVTPPDLYLPESIHGRQNVSPTYCSEFDGGFILVPQFGSGFWFIPRLEMDEYLRGRNIPSAPIQSARTGSE
jgi:hypothetical protein